jgi:uncharacterized membrane protein YbjE (DUF340 family)
VNSERIRDRFMPWAGIALGTLGAGFAHQLGADSAFQDCRVGSPFIVIIGTIVGLALVALGALGSWRVYGGDGETPARRMLATVSLMACAVFAIAIILPFIAAMVIPGCWQ